MSQAASQAAAFYRDVAKNLKLWTICDDQGYPAPLKAGGQRAMPFWSTLSRVKRIIKSVPAYGVFEPEELSWDTFVEKFVPDLKEHSMLVGVNWSGPRAVGYDLEPDDVVANVTHYARSDSAVSGQE